MALHLNLYHEVQKQKALKRRDPLKLAVIGLAFVAACFAGYYLLQLNSQRLISNELNGLEGEYSTFSKKAEASKSRETEATATIKASEELVKRMENRFYWAPVLASVAQIVPPQVQITKLAGDVSSDGVKRCTLTIDGIAAGEDPRKVAEDLRRSLAEQFSTKYKSVNSVFRSLEDSPETVTLNGQKVPTAIFGINVVMQVGESPESEKPAGGAKTAQK